MTIPVLVARQRTVKLSLGYCMRITEVPAGLPVEHDYRELFDENTIGVPRTMGSVWFHVYGAPAFTSCDGLAVFAADLTSVQCDNIEVEPTHRNKGLATAMYKIASYIFDAPVVPSSTQLFGGQLFWARKTQIYCRSVSGLLSPGYTI
jgi:hypothetical protein